MKYMVCGSREPNLSPLEWEFMISKGGNANDPCGHGLQLESSVEFHV